MPMHCPGCGCHSSPMVDGSCTLCGWSPPPRSVSTKFEPVGWVCTKCGRCNGPHVDTCQCGPRVDTAAVGTGDGYEWERVEPSKPGPPALCQGSACPYRRRGIGQIDIVPCVDPLNPSGATIV